MSKKQQQQTAVEAGESHFGVCRTCYATDGYINIGKGHWFFRKAHKVCWCVGANLFSSWQYETEKQQRNQFNKLKFGTFTDVEPYYAPVPENDVNQIRTAVVRHAKA
jgi:hypothetical protein